MQRRVCECIYILFFTLLPSFSLDVAYTAMCTSFVCICGIYISIELPGDPDEGYQIFTQNSLEKAQSLLHGFSRSPTEGGFLSPAVLHAPDAGTKGIAFVFVLLSALYTRSRSAEREIKSCLRRAGHARTHGQRTLIRFFLPRPAESKNNEQLPVTAARSLLLVPALLTTTTKNDDDHYARNPI